MIDIDKLRQALGAVQPEEVEELLDRLEAAEKLNAKLREALAEKVASETMLRDLSVGNGHINASFEGGAVHLLVDALANQFVESSATNYLEMQFHSNVTGPLVVTLQRLNGRTPHQLRAEAEKERDALRAKIAEMERQEPVAWARKLGMDLPSFGCVTDLKYRPSDMPESAYMPLYALPGAQPAPSVPDATVLLRRAAMAMEVVGTEWRESDPTLRLDLASALAAAAQETKP